MNLSAMEFEVERIPERDLAPGSKHELNSLANNVDLSRDKLDLDTVESALLEKQSVDSISNISQEFQADSASRSTTVRRQIENINHQAEDDYNRLSD
mmetsp:Transcript_62230/g.134862  ORF Transcript_62230/g.134862 Transcript_62230/m.134862 type:complete len:97 (-) Transcript_62230:649-939(-)